MLGLLGGIIAASIISSFEEVLTKNLILAAYIPLIVYVSDAVGTQMEAFVIRDFAIHSRLRFKKYFVRQLLIVLLIGLVLSASLFAISFALYTNAAISLVLSLSLFAAITSSIFTGLLIPYLFHKIDLDPANASGPIATIIQDLASVSIYFFFAHALLK